ncbi:hypothetical protein SUDANB121_05292 [Nocardiopsis dassonvillei]
MHGTAETDGPAPRTVGGHRPVRSPGRGGSGGVFPGEAEDGTRAAPGGGAGQAPAASSSQGRGASAVARADRRAATAARASL